MKPLNDNERFSGIDYRHTDVAARFRKEIKRLKEKAEADKRAAESALVKVAKRAIGKP